MSSRPEGERDRMTKLVIGLVIFAGVVARLLVARSPGFPSDVGTFMAWAERLAEIGPGRFYEPGYFSDYPPGFLYVLWLLGAAFDGDLLRAAVKTVSIPADIALAILLARLVWQHAGRGAAIVAAALWSLQPAPIFAGPYWGQVDAVGTLPFLAALLAAGARRWVLAGALAGLAMMIKPQFTLALGVVLVAAATLYIRDRDWRPGVRAASAAAVTAIALALPFGLGVGPFVALIRSASETYPYTSLYAFNIWAVVGDFWKPDDAYVVIGGVLLVVGLGASVIPLWWRRDTAALLAVGAAAAMAFYFLPTRAHERYLFPALALLLPFAVLRRRIIVPYTVLAGGFFVTLYFAFSRYPQNDLAAPAWLEATAFSRNGQNAIAVVMLGAGALLCWRLARGEAQLVSTNLFVRAVYPREAVLADPAAGVAPEPRRWSLPAALGPGHPARRRDLLVALAVALTVLATRGYRLDQPRDMYFDEVYHARTAMELLAQREPYEWTHPHLAKELMALGILAFGSDRIAGEESGVSRTVAFAVGNDGVRAYVRDDGVIQTIARDGAPGARITRPRPARAISLDGRTLYGVDDAEVFAVSLDDVATPRTLPRGSSDPVTAFAMLGDRFVVGSASGTTLLGPVDTSTATAATPTRTFTPSVAIAAKPDGSDLYLVDPTGAVHVLNSTTGAETKTYPSVGVVRSAAYVQGPHALLLARADEPVIDLIDTEDGHRDQAPLGNARTGSFTAGATALATVPRTDFVYAIADGRVVVIDPHGLSPFAAIAVGDRTLLGIDGTGDTIVVAGRSLPSVRIETGRHALAWRLPGIVAAALLAFMLVLLARRLFASRILPLLVGIVVIIDGSMFAQARIGMNDTYVALFIVSGWYFIVAAHRPRLSPSADLLIAGALLGLGAASKWAAFYTLAGVLVAALAVTVHAYVKGRPGSGGPLDLLAGRGRNAVLLFVSFAVVPIAIYWASYLHWFGGPTAPYGWDLVELTKQMYWYHSGLTSPHPAASPWWSWPLILKPVYWYYGQSDGSNNAYIYDAGNIVLFWGALAATVWCGIAAIRARSAALGFAVFALLVQYVAWIPISRVLFFYHFYTALPFYLLALAVGLVMLWESGRSRWVVGYLGLAAAAFVFFYPFVSGQPVPAQQAAMFFILPTWQYDCQFYPSFVCPVSGPTDIPLVAIASRLAFAGVIGALAAGAFIVARSPRTALAVARDGLWRARSRTRSRE